MEDTPAHEELSPEAKELALKAKNQLNEDVKMLSSKIDASIATIQQQINILHELQGLIVKRVETETPF